MDPDQIKKLKVAKYLCQTSTLFFTRYFFKKRQHKKFVVGDHHKIICDALDKVTRGEIKRLIINIAPRYGKTELAVKNFIARGLAINPAARFIHLSYADDLALDNSEEVKDIVNSAEYQQLFNIKIKPNSDSKKKWYTTAGGGLYATSSGGQVTGFGAGKVDDPELNEEMNYLSGVDGQLFGGALIIDDPIKPDDADSETVRERVNNKFDSTISNRVNSRNTPIIIIMQRLHENDLCGYLMKQSPGEWTVISLPCVKTDGTALWDFKHTVEELARIREKNEVVFDRQYMQDPKPLKGLLFPLNELRYYVPKDLEEKDKDGKVKMMEPDAVNAYCDVADEGEDCLSAWFGLNYGKDIFITKIVHNNHGTDTTEEQVALACKELKPAYIRVESNNQGRIWGKNLAKRPEMENTKVLFSRSTQNKFSRIFNDADFIKKHFVFLHTNNQDTEYKAAMKELGSYLRNGQTKKHDDAPDAASGLARFIRGVLASVYA